MDERESREQRSRARQIGILTAIPAVLLAGPLVGALLGKLLDAHLGSAPWGLMAGLAFGFAAAGVEVVRLLRFVNEDRSDDGSDGPDDETTNR